MLLACLVLTPRIFDQNTISRQNSRIGFSQSVDGPDPELVSVSMPQIWTIHTPVFSALCYANGSPIRRFFWCIRCFGHVNSFNNIACNVAASVIDRRSPMYDTIIVKYVSNIDVSRRSGLIYYRIKNNKKKLFIIYIYIYNIYYMCCVS